jgi:NDP-4-keto-2,6-dideoxyhexose 3-C-methyltransferase
MKCRNCKKKKFIKIINIGSQPISSRSYKSIKNLKKYPLDLYECRSCSLVQLSKVAPSREMYGDTYGYWTGLSNLMINHMKKKITYLKSTQKIKKNSKVLDIGSSDPTFLNLLKQKEKSLDLFAIDPSSAKFKKSFEDKKINLIVDYFSKDKVYNFLKFKNFKKHKFSLITSFAMFYDVNDPNSFCKDINSMLEKNGLWIVEFSYFPLLLKNLTFDQINHEHVTYYTLSTFNNIAKKNGLKIIDVNFNEINGGSAEVIVSKKDSRQKVNTKKLEKILKEEKAINNYSYKKFNLRLQNVKKVINHFFDNAKKIIGYGASTKGNIILNHSEVNRKDLRFICDGNQQKWGQYTPGSNVKIISKEKMRKLNPKYLFVLIWSFRSEVIKQEIKFILKGGKLVFPLPIFHIIDKNNYKHFINKKLESFGFNI